jgi:hypothetical protein
VYGVSVDSGVAIDVGVLDNLSFLRCTVADRDCNSLISLLRLKALPNP